ncbi:MAG: hypothetical protein GWO02_04460, partial [Gammaproteobacteria bacterium]|nr:hypothetical protein [Gammaproteobacteria bacterium]
ADVRGRLILRHAEPEGVRYARREPVLFGAPAAWLTRPDIVVDTARLRLRGPKDRRDRTAPAPQTAILSK